MINLVLQRLETLQSELADLDHRCETGTATRVAAMVAALREVAAEAQTVRQRSVRHLEDLRVRANAG